MTSTPTYDPYAPPAEPKPRPWLRTLLIVALAFVAGIAAMGYALHRWQDAARMLDIAPEPAAPAPTPSYALRAPTPPPSAGQLDRRMAEIEGRMSQIDARARAAVGNADRAEGLLVAFAARRALDRGVPLGYIEGLLRERFGGSQPQAVATIIAGARQPVTLDQLRSGLAEAAPALMTADPDDGWWTALQRELRGLVVLRKADAPSAAPNDRLLRARTALEAGQVDAALAEVARLPGHDRADVWISSARRYVSARSALDMIETAALLAPRDEAAIIPEDESAEPASDAVGNSI